MRGFLVASVMLFGFISISVGERAGEFWNQYCAEKTDGNHEHPSDCHKFVTCVYKGRQGFERDCAACDIDPVRCPKGVFVYDITRNRCEYENEVECRVAKKEKKPDPQ